MFLKLALSILESAITLWYVYIYVIRKFKWPKDETKILKVFSCKRFVEVEFLRDLRTIDWSRFLNFTGIDSMLCIYIYISYMVLVALRFAFVTIYILCEVFDSI